MKPTESSWQKKYWRLMAYYQLLLQLREDGEYYEHEWYMLIEQMQKHGMWGTANDIRRDMRKEMN